MSRIALALPILFALPLHAQDLSAEIGRTGLAAVETRLAALPAPTDEERFTLGGVHFLRALEISFQDRWREGLTDRTGMVPFLRLPITENPAPQPFQPGTVVGIFHKAGAELDLAKAALSAIPETSGFGATIALNDLWLDVNANGTREPEEDLAGLLGSALAQELNSDDPAALHQNYTFRFDVADAAWLAAYADMLNTFCNLVQAYDPTTAITRVLDARAGTAKLGPLQDDWFMGGAHVPDTMDMIAIVLAALNQTPDTARMAQAQGNLLAMIDENRSFWSRVARERDDAQEWLPNAVQHSAFGIEVPPEAGPAWLAVLDEMQAIVEGRKLVPYWRVGAPAGINVAKLFTDPRPVDFAGWLQGWAAMPYLEKGTMASSATLDAFDQAVGGRSMLFSLYFN